MKHQLALAAVLLSCTTSAFAQRGNIDGRNNGNNNNFNNRNQNQNNGNNRNGNNRGGGTLPLPEGIEQIVSIDAFNVLLAQGRDDDDQVTLTPLTVNHVYSGGIAALFGGTSIPTDVFVSPGSLNNGGGGGFGGGQFGGGFGVGGFGGNQGNQGFGNQGNQGFGNQGNQGFGNQGFGNQGFGNQGFGNQGNQGFGNQGFNGNFAMNPTVGVNGTGINNGFNVAGNGQIFRTPNGGFATSQTSVLGPNGQRVPLTNGPTFVR